MSYVRYVLVGEAPNGAGEGSGLDAYLLARAMGIGPTFRRDPRGCLRLMARAEPDAFQWACRTRHVNLLDSWPGRSSKGSRFPITPEVRKRAAALDFTRRWGPSPSGLIMCGRRVAEAFGEKGAPLFENLCECPERPVYAVPHPSGVNRWWNAPENRLLALDFLRGLGSP